MSNLKYSSVPV